MILSRQSIRARCVRPEYVLPGEPKDRAPMIDPFVPDKTTHPSGLSYGLSHASYDCRIKETLVLRPGQFAIASTVERFVLPADIYMSVRDKSTLLRRGLYLGNSFADPGWRGWLTIELFNAGDEQIVLEAGQPVCQVVFEQLDEPTELPYTGKYQDQPDEAVEPRRG